MSYGEMNFDVLRVDEENINLYDWDKGEHFKIKLDDSNQCIRTLYYKGVLMNVKIENGKIVKVYRQDKLKWVDLK